jgi:hypothetical protein
VKSEERTVTQIERVDVFVAAPGRNFVTIRTWINATRPGPDGGQMYGTTDPADRTLFACWTSQRPAEDHVRRLLEAVAAGRVEL